MARLSLAMIVRDEARLLGRILADASNVCDELVVLDTGSTDGTREIAEELGATVHDLAWRDDFATARTASFAWCHEDWIMWLDADDVLPEATQLAIVGLKNWLDTADAAIGAVLAPYHDVITDDGHVLLSQGRPRVLHFPSTTSTSGDIMSVSCHVAARTAQKAAAGKSRAPRLNGAFRSSRI